MGRPGWAAVGAWATLAMLALLAVGGAASQPGGRLLGVPGPSVALAAVAGLALVALLSGSRGGAVACLGLCPIPLLLLLGAPIPGVGALSGPPLLALVFAGLALLLARTHAPLARAAFFPLILLLYLTVAWRVQAQVGPQGDEPHYLMVADSLLRDHDLELEQDYAQGRYRAFHPGELAPHYRVRGREGRIYSLHAVGLSLLVLPAYALGGYPGASFFMALLAALLALEIRGLLREVWGGGAAEAVSWLVALSPPLVHYAGLVFTEIPAALAVAFALRRGRALGERGFAGAAAVGAAVALLPWLNVRYAILAVLLLAYGLAGRVTRRSALAFVLPGIVSAVGLAAFHYALYGFFDPRRVYGARPELSLASIPEGLQGLLLDQEFGLLVYAPVFVLALPGLLTALRERPRLALTSGAMVIAVVLTAAAWPMWRGGWNPPARFLVPLVPVLAVGVAAWLRRGLPAGAALLIGWGLWTGLAGAWEPRLVHRDRDGTAPLFRELSGAEEWTQLLPGYVLEEPDRHRLALIWTVALAAGATRWGAGGATAMGVTVAVAGLLAACSGASTVALRTSQGRDAVRVLGRPALSVPGWTWVNPAPAVWGSEVLGWGPLYEPHRHPDGAELGGRFRLAAGSYRLVLLGEELGEGEAGPVLIAECGEDPGRRSRWSFEKVAGGWAAVFDLPGAQTTTLRLLSGGPFLVRSITLTAQPFRLPPV